MSLQSIKEDLFAVSIPQEPQDAMLNMQLTYKIMKAIRIPRGCSCTVKTLRVSLVASTSNGKKYLAQCYSTPFHIYSNQRQLGAGTKIQRKRLMNSKRQPIIAVPYFALKKSFHISNVGKEQLHDRNLMGEHITQGRYPIVHYDSFFFQQILFPEVAKNFWLEFDLVDNPCDDDLSSQPFYRQPSQMDLIPLQHGLFETPKLEEKFEREGSAIELDESLENDILRNLMDNKCDFELFDSWFDYQIYDLI